MRLFKACKVKVATGEDKIFPPSVKGDVLGVMYEIVGLSLRLFLSNSRVLKYVSGIRELLVTGSLPKELMDKLVGRLAWSLVIITSGKLGLKTGR